MKILLIDAETSKQIPFNLNIDDYSIELSASEDSNNWKPEFEHSLFITVKDGILVIVRTDRSSGEFRTWTVDIFEKYIGR